MLSIDYLVFVETRRKQELLGSYVFSFSPVAGDLIHLSDQPEDDQLFRVKAHQHLAGYARPGQIAVSPSVQLIVVCAKKWKG